MAIWLNQPVSDNSKTWAVDIKVSDVINDITRRPSLTVTAFTNMPELAELKVLGLDRVYDLYEPTNGIESRVAPKMKRISKLADVKNIARMFKNVDIIEHGVTVTEYGNDTKLVTATADINNNNKWTFDTVAGIAAGDTVKIIQNDSSNGTVVALVEVTAVDKTTKEITFDTNVTIKKWDWIKYVSSPAAWCQPVTKGLNTDLGWGKVFTYYYQLFARTFDVKVQDFNKTFQSQEQLSDFMYITMWKSQEEMWEEVANQFRNGAGNGGQKAQIMGYNTLIEKRDAGWIESIIDMSWATNAKELNNKLTAIFKRMFQAPIKNPGFVMLINDTFFDTLYRMDQDLIQANLPYSLNFKAADVIYEWFVKYESPRYDVPTMYLSQSLSKEFPDEPKAFILPQNYIGLFIPPYINVGDNMKLEANALGKVVTQRDTSISAPGCKTFLQFMSLGIAYGGFSFRDTFFRLDKFNY